MKNQSSNLNYRQKLEHGLKAGLERQTNRENLATGTKGITLVALVVTIVVLLILAGITITYVFSDNGILSQAQTAANKTDVATVLEEIEQRLLTIQAGNKGSYSNEDVQTVVAEVIGKEKDDIEIGVETVTTENGNEVDISNLWIDGTSSGGSSGGSSVATISTTDSYVGYYADIDADGTVDGVIFADLMFEAKNSPWSSNTSYESYGTYSWTVLTEGVKSYYVSQGDYDGAFGTIDVIAPVGGTTGEARFYVMALEDVDSSLHCWYSSAGGVMTNYASVTSGDFGTGKANTGKMVEIWKAGDYGTQNANSSFPDVWGLDAVQTGYTNGWFVPSRGEWAAFAGELVITKNDYSSTYRY